MPGLLDWDIDPAELSAMAQNAGTPTWTPGGAAPDADPNGGTMPIAAPAASGPGFWGKAGSVIGDIGSALGGGLDPSITGEAASIAGRRALLNFSLQMLANSGPSYTPRNFGQILASGLDAAGQSNRYTEESRLKAQQVNATLALKLGQQQIQNYLATITGAKAAKDLGVANRVADAARGAGGGTAPAAGDTVPPAGGGAAPASAGDFVTQNAPVFADIAQRTGLPVEFVAGQAANESDWGRSPAATQGFNLFGVSKDNKPVRYASQQEATDDYVSLLNNRYSNVPRTGTPAEIGGALGKAGWNTVVPDYGQRVGNFATQATPFLPRPAGAGAGAPSGGAAPPAPSGTPPSPGTEAVAPPAPLIPRVTLPPPDFSDIPGRRAAVKATYDEQLANTANAMDPTFREKAETEKRASNAAIDTEVANRRAAHADKVADFEAKQNEAEAKLAQQKADAEAERKNRIDIEAAKAKAAIDTAGATNIGHIMAKRLEVSGADAEGARQLASKVDQLELVAPVIMQGGPDFVADQHPELRNVLRLFGAGTESQWAKWNAQDTWQQVMKQLQVGANAAFKGSVSDYEERIAGASFQTLSQDPQNIPIALGMLRAAINRKQQIDALRNDYASSPEGRANGTAGMERWVNSQLPGYDAEHPLDPPPLFQKPPPLTAPALKPGTPERAAAEAADTAATSDYINAKDKARGIPFQIWQTIKGADGKDQRVLGWAVKGPDGRWHTQEYQRGG